MRLASMRCTSKFPQDAKKVTVIFHSADLLCMALYVLDKLEAEGYNVGQFYEFEAKPQIASRATH